MLLIFTLFSNAYPPIDSSPSGKIIEVKPKQSLKQDEPIPIIVSGILIVFSEVQFENRLDERIFKSCGNEILSRFLQFLKALEPISVTELGIWMVEIPQPSKALVLIDLSV